MRQKALDSVTGDFHPNGEEGVFLFGYMMNLENIHLLAVLQHMQDFSLVSVRINDSPFIAYEVSYFYTLNAFSRHCFLRGVFTFT